jgi:CPA1 family monovalent cation:H+ antiporter
LEAIVTILTLLLAVIVSGSLARFTRLPLPLVQIVLGVIIALSFVKTVELKPEIFFLLFLPPLLFLDGWRIPKTALFRDRTVILELSLGLVVMTVIGAGFLIHWLIPAMPLPVAFALAAVVSPTDPIAVSAIADRTPIPKRMLHILEGESLLNDASGLVCMRFAVAAMLTGSFSLSEAFLTFLWMALGGVAIGVCVTWAVTRVKQWVTDSLGEDTSAQILISLLMPFGAYLVAEHFHCSGILAAVAAGVTMGLAEQSGLALGVTRVHRAAVWDTVQFAANGVIFVLLGEQLPGIVAGASKTVLLTGHHEPWWLAVYVLMINVGLAALRFAWVWTSLRWTLFRAARRGERPLKTGWRLVMAMSLAGVRGAITLAGVLTLPFTLNDGAAFPAPRPGDLPGRRGDRRFAGGRQRRPPRRVEGPGPAAGAVAPGRRGQRARRGGRGGDPRHRGRPAHHGRRAGRRGRLYRDRRPDHGPLSPEDRRPPGKPGSQGDQPRSRTDRATATPGRRAGRTRRGLPPGPRPRPRRGGRGPDHPRTRPARGPLQRLTGRRG